MERYRQIYQEMLSLLGNLKSTDSKPFGYRMAFQAKMKSLEIMYFATLEKSKKLEVVAKKEMAEKKALLKETGKAWNETVAFFEAYLNAFYSLLQVIAKITPYFYEEEKSESLRKMASRFVYNFGKLMKYFKDNPNFDPEFSSYIATKLRWYEILRNNRHTITHQESAFLGFKEDGKIVFLDYPKKGFSWFKQKKSTRELEDYLTRSFHDLFDFLGFYVKHFRHIVKS